MALEIADVGRQAGFRFQVVNAIPAATLATVIGLLALSGGFGSNPSLATLDCELDNLDLRALAIAAFSIFSLSLITNSFPGSVCKGPRRILASVWPAPMAAGTEPGATLRSPISTWHRACGRS
jgi:hypothetical protein